MQRLFSSFPPGWPGLGLLLLRMAAGVSLAVQGLACVSHGPWTSAFGLMSMGTGALLSIGFLTPVAGGVAALLGAGVALSLLPPSVPNVLGGVPATIFAILMAVAVVLLGPGAFSLDARLFGRREIAIPQVSRRSPEDGA